MRTLVFATAVIVLTVAAAAAIKSGSPAAAAMDLPQSSAALVDDLHRRVDMRSLPELDIGDPYRGW